MRAASALAVGRDAPRTSGWTGPHPPTILAIDGSRDCWADAPSRRSYAMRLYGTTAALVLLTGCAAPEAADLVLTHGRI